MKKTLLALSLLSLVACSDNKAADLTDKQVAQYVAQPLIVHPQRGQYADTPPLPPQQEDGEASGYSNGELAAGVIAGAAVGALAANALSGGKSSRKVEKCDWDDHPNEPECRGTTKYYKWKREQDAKKRAELSNKRKVAAMKKKRKPQ
jgi:hypothetical protein